MQSNEDRIIEKNKTRKIHLSKIIKIHNNFENYSSENKLPAIYRILYSSTHSVVIRTKFAKNFRENQIPVLKTYFNN